jgi:glycerol-3-phosphate dehydrogenase subunit B
VSTTQGRSARGHDAIVIGAGLAGLTAACRLAEAGARVLVLAKGSGSTNLWPGTIDVLGYAPDRVDGPAGELPGFLAANPGHPYGLVGVDGIAEAVEWFRDRFADERLPGYAYRGDMARNHLLPTAVGVPKPSALLPETMAAGDVREGYTVAIVSFRSLRDFHPMYLADNLARADAGPGIEARGISLDLRPEDRVEINALGLARAFDDPGFRAQVAGALTGRLDGVDRVGFPAALGIEDPQAAWKDMERRLERPVFEIPTLPPSVPGMRADRVLRAGLTRAGARVIRNSPVVGVERDGDRVTAVRAHTSGRDTVYPTQAVVLATGGFSAGGLELDSDWAVRETVMGLPLTGVPEGDRFNPEYFGSQPMSRAGVAADEGLRPVDGRGDRVCSNVFIAGATLAGSEPWREGSGAGVSLATGHRAAGLVLEEAA